MKADTLADVILKPMYVKKPAKDEMFNYIVDIFTSWHGSNFYFCAKYHCPSPNAITPFFEEKFARIKFIGSGRFSLSFMRYTGQWIEIYSGLTLDECLEAVKDEPWFQL